MSQGKRGFSKKLLIPLRMLQNFAIAKVASVYSQHDTHTKKSDTL